MNELSSLESKLASLVATRSPSGQGVAECIPLWGLAIPEDEAKETFRGDVALDVCFALARELAIPVEELAIWLAQRVRAELGIEAVNERGFVNLTLPNSYWWGDPLPPSNQEDRGGDAQESVIVIPAPSKGAVGLEYARFVMHPLAQAITLAGTGQSPLLGRSVRVVCGARDFMLSKSRGELFALWEYLLERSMRSAPQPEDLPPAEQAARLEGVAGLVWWWTWEDFRSDDALQAFLKSSEWGPFYPDRKGRFVVGCSKKLLGHIPEDESMERLDLSAPKDRAGFLLYAISDAPGPEFVPSVSFSSGRRPPQAEGFDTTHLAQWSHSVLGRCQSGLLSDAVVSSEEETSAFLGQTPLGRELLVAAKLLPRVQCRAGTKGAVGHLGRVLPRVLSKTQRFLNTPRYNTALSAGDPVVGHVVSSIYRSIVGVLTVVENSCLPDAGFPSKSR